MQVVKMKLAAALQLRKVLMTANEINHNVPLDQSSTVDAKKFNGTAEEAKNFSYYPIMDVIGPLQYNKLALQIVDACIHRANTATTITVAPTILNGEFDTLHNPKEVAWAGVLAVSLDLALLRRTYLQAMVEKLTYYCDSSLKEPTLVEDCRRPGDMSMGIEPRMTVKDNSFLRQEAVRALNFYQARLNRLDVAIQEVNWSVDVELPGWVQDHYSKVPKKSLKSDSLPN